MSTQLDYTITLTQNISGSIEPLNVGPYYLRKGPAFNTNNITGENLGQGTWKFPNYSEGEYELWDSVSKIEKWGRKFLTDLTPVYDSITINGNAIITGSLVVTDLYVNSTTNFSGSINANSNDIAHVDNLQVHTLSENNSGAGITFSHSPKFAGTISGSSALTNVAFTDNKYYPVSGTNATLVYTPTNFKNPVVFSYTQPPVCGVAPTSNTHISNKGYVDSEISTRINQFVTGSFQQSPNVLRLIPNGNVESNKVSIDWRNCLVWGSGSTQTNQKTVLIEGNGTSNAYASIQTELTHNKYVTDWTHFKGLGVVTVELNGADIPSGSFEVDTLGKVVFENINFYADDLGLGNFGEIKNIRFVNCRWSAKQSAVLTFTSCEFQNNYFDSEFNNQFNFINCFGSPISANKPVTITGTNKLSVDYTQGISVIGNLQINGNAVGAAPANTDITVTKGHGDTGSGIVLGSPQAWMQVVSGSNTYSVPMYLN